MARSRTPIVVALIALIVMLAGAACTENPVGNKCFLGDLDGGSPTTSVISSPALDCTSHICLQVPLQRQLPPDSEYTPLCTAECESEDDCDKVPVSKCQTGFTCAIPVVVGPFCCRKMCVCRDYLVIPDGGLPTPQACDPGDSRNTCVNL